MLDHRWAKTRSGEFFEFVCRTGAEEIDELVKGAASADSWVAFDASLASGIQRERFSRLCAAWQAPSGQAAYEALRKSAVHSIDEHKLIELVEARLASLVMGLPRTAAGELARLIDETPHRQLTADYVWDWLIRNGVRRMLLARRRHITGSVADARLTWYVAPYFTLAYWCNLPIPAAPIETVPVQIATVAIPTLIRGKQIAYKACLWQPAPFVEECSSILP